MTVGSSHSASRGNLEGHPHSREGFQTHCYGGSILESLSFKDETRLLYYKVNDWQSFVTKPNLLAQQNTLFLSFLFSS